MAVNRRAFLTGIAAVAVAPILPAVAYSPWTSYNVTWGTVSTQRIGDTLHIRGEITAPRADGRYSFAVGS